MKDNKFRSQKSPLSFVLASLTILVFFTPQLAIGQNTSGTIECITIEDNQTSVAGPSPSPEVIPQLDPEVARGISNISDIENATGSNKQIFANNTDIDSNVTTLQGMEKSQLGNAITGQQDVILEGDIIRNATHQCWKN
ncbi:MAG: hypothetical protein AB7U98_00080 [Candidatus Nitrosocosmicus sp.]